MCKLLLSICIVLLVVQRSCCYPEFWIFPEHSGVDRVHKTPITCFDHPVDGWGRHPGPMNDTKVVHQMILNGKSTTKLCPGETYTFKIKFPQKRYAMVTAQGLSFVKNYNKDIDKDLDKRDGMCPGRLVLDDHINSDVGGVEMEFSADATVDCDAAAKLVVQSSSSAMASDAYHKASATFQVDKSCATSKCAEGAPPSRGSKDTPSSSPAATTAPAPSTSPSTSPSTPPSTPSNASHCTIPLKLILLVLLVLLVPWI